MVMNSLPAEVTGTLSTQVVYNTECNEWIVRFYVRGKYQQGADYHTDNKSDAQETAKHWRDNGQVYLG